MKSFLLLTLLAFCLEAKTPWQKSPDQWTEEDARRIISSSPWAQSANATFPDPRRKEPSSSAYSLPGAAEAGLAGPKSSSDGRWDGGVGRNTGGGLLPTLSVLIRWNSSAPVRQAMLKLKDPHALDDPKNYLISVEGLVPAGQYSATGKLEKKSSSDENASTRAIESERVLEGLISHSKLVVNGHPVIACEDAKIDPQTGIVYLFFPRTFEIKKSDKDLSFFTRFGSLQVEKRFHLGDLVYNGHLEL